MALVDVIIPTFNRQMLLKRSLSSVLSQSFADFLVWVVDDGSTDETLHFLRSLQDPRIRIISSTENRGVSSSRNLGIRSGEAPYIALLDSDDEWKPEKLQLQMVQLQNRPDYALSHTEEIWWRDQKAIPVPTRYRKSGGWLFDRCIDVCCISPSTTVIRRSIVESVGLFREDFVVCEDFELWLRICAKFEVGFISDPMVIKHGGHEDQLSMKYKAMDYWRVKALVPFLSSDIAGSSKNLVRQSIRHRCEILLKGYEKYQQQNQQVDDVRGWYKLVLD